jgi:hypothetical protein
MEFEYKVAVFVPTINGCVGQDNGWDQKRISQYQTFLNQNAAGGWKFSSSDYRQVTAGGCGGGAGAWLVCVFERPRG